MDMIKIRCRHKQNGRRMDTEKFLKFKTNFEKVKEMWRPGERNSEAEVCDP